MRPVLIYEAKKLGDGLPLRVREGHVVELSTTDEPLTSQAGLFLFYGMAEVLNIPKILDEEIRVKVRSAGYPESEHILALAASIFQGGDYLEDLEALREDVVTKAVIGRKETPDPTTAGDFCRRFYAGHVLQEVILLLRAGSECQILTLWTDAAAVAAMTASVSYKEAVFCLLEKDLLRGEQTVEIFKGVGGTLDPGALRLYLESKKDAFPTVWIRHAGDH